MTAPLSDEQLAEWRTLAEAATEGPWRARRGDHDGDWPIEVATGAYLCVSPDDGVRGGHSPADAAFVAAAREAMPALLDEVERLREENERLERRPTMQLSREVAHLSGIVAAVEKLHEHRVVTVRSLHCQDEHEGYDFPASVHGDQCLEDWSHCTHDGCAWPCPTWRALHPVPKPEPATHFDGSTNTSGATSMLSSRPVPKPEPKTPTCRHGIPGRSMVEATERCSTCGPELEAARAENLWPEPEGGTDA